MKLSSDIPSLNDAKQVFASKYSPTLPTAEELQSEIEEERRDGESKNRRCRFTPDLNEIENRVKPAQNKAKRGISRQNNA